jgi:hypothetical protein
MENKIKLEDYLNDPAKFKRKKAGFQARDIDAGALDNYSHKNPKDNAGIVNYLKDVRLLRFAEVLLNSLEEPILRDIRNSTYPLSFYLPCLDDRSYWDEVQDRQDYCSSAEFDQAKMKNAIINPIHTKLDFVWLTTYLSVLPPKNPPRAGLPTEDWYSLEICKGGPQEIVGGTLPAAPRLEEIMLEYMVRLGWLYIPAEEEVRINHEQMDNFQIHRQYAIDCRRTPVEGKKAEYVEYLFKTSI